MKQTKLKTFAVPTASESFFQWLTVERDTKRITTDEYRHLLRVHHPRHVDVRL